MIVVPVIPHADLPGAGVWWDVAPAEVSTLGITAACGPSTKATSRNRGGSVDILPRPKVGDSSCYTDWSNS